MSNKIKHFYEFGEFRFLPNEKCLWRDGELLSLSPKALDVLFLLLEKHSEIVTREEIIKDVWKDTFIEEANLTVAVSNLRKSLGQNKENKFIQTIPKKGYRFVADVNKVIEEEKEIEVKNEVNQRSKEVKVVPENVLKKNSNRWYLVTIILVAILFVTSFGLWTNYWGEGELSKVPINKRNIKSIAVLPLKSLSETTENKALLLGMTDSLISRLGKLNRFAVRPLSSVDKFGDSDKDAIEFGESLKVDAVLVGTFQTNENRLRINVRLLDVRDGAQIWSNSYDETESDFFKLQDDLSLQVANSLVSILTEKDTENLTNSETQNKAAFQAYSRGQFHLAKRDETGMRKAIQYFNEAIELDKNYVAAYVGIADAYLLLSDSGFAYAKPLEYSEQIKTAIDKALEVNPNSAEAYSSKASFVSLMQYDVKKASEYYEKSISINPNIAKSHHWFAWNLLAQKKFDKAKRELLKAQDLDPTSRIIATELGMPYFYQEEYEKAIDYFRQAIEMDKNFFQARFRLWLALHNNEQYDAALKELKVMKELTSEDSHFYALPYAMTLAKAGKIDESKKLYSKMTAKEKSAKKYVSPILLSATALALDKERESLKWLEQANQENNEFLPFIDLDPSFKNLRDNSQFQELVAKVNK